MRKFFVLILFAMSSMPAWTQEADEPAADAEAVSETEAAAEPEPEIDEEDPEFDETGLDEQGFSNEDDDFNPSEDIPADQSIEFPADI